MATIDTYLEDIKNKTYGEDVRDAIHDGILQCYQDSTANAQIERIIEKGQETFNSIPENYSTLTDEVGVLKVALNYHTGATVVDFIKGYYIKTNGETVDVNEKIQSGVYQCAVVDCVPGDIFTINGTGGGVPRLWCFVDSDSNVITGQVSASNATFSGTLVAPANAAKLILNKTMNQENDTPCFIGLVVDDRIRGIINSTSHSISRESHQITALKLPETETSNLLNLSDENGNLLLYIDESGYIHSVNFNTKDARKQLDTASSVIKNSNGITNFKKLPYQSDALNVSDEDGNTLLRFDYQGDMITKNFNAFRTPDTAPVYSHLKYDFAVQDNNGNIAFSILNGLAITNQRLYGKKLSIIGDSISSFDGWVPEGYPAYYPQGNLTKVDDTWWKKLIDELGLVLLKNCSWSGSRVSGDSLGTAYAACSDARINELAGENNEAPDIVICYISTNDWGNAIPLGSFGFHDEIPEDGVIDNISQAYALMLYKIRTRYPKAQVYCMLSLEGKRSGGDTVFPNLNRNGIALHEVNHAIVEIAHIFGCNVIDLETSGIHYWNINDYTVDGYVHPNVKGAEIIKETAKMALLATYKNI